MPAGLAPELSTAKYAALFAREAREQLQHARDAVRAMTTGGPRHEIDALFRIVHTLKGMAATMGYTGVEEVAHALEDTLGGAHTAADDRGTEIVFLLPAAIDALDDAVEACIAAGASASGAPTSAGAPPHGIRDHVAATGDVVRKDARTFPVLGGEVASAADAPAAGTSAPRTLRVDVAALDRLLDLAGALTNARDRVADAAARSGDVPLARAVAELARVSGALADEVRAARLVALADLLAELPRIVRQAARATGKRVLLDTAGGDVVADRAVIDALAEPLTHLLRNAVDHGIEAPDERARAGKRPDGHVSVRAARDGNALVVRVDDDGRGIDRAAVIARAQARGQLPAGVADSTVDDATLLDCLALPGLTTAREVGRVSGRGVGVDAALARVRALGGSLAVRTTAGEGTCFTLRMPLSWAIVPALVVRAGAAAYAIPLAHVLGTRDTDSAEPSGQPAPSVVTAPRSLAALLGARAVGRSELAGTERIGPTVAGTEIVLLAATRGAPTLSVQVDEIVGARDCVLKPLAIPRGAFRIAAGATILEGGEVALVLDVPAVAARIATLALDDTLTAPCHSPPPPRSRTGTAPTTHAR